MSIQFLFAFLASFVFTQNVQTERTAGRPCWRRKFKTGSTREVANFLVPQIVACHILKYPPRCAYKQSPSVLTALNFPFSFSTAVATPTLKIRRSLRYEGNTSLVGKLPEGTSIFLRPNSNRYFVALTKGKLHFLTN